jgi:hypothetical protein
LPEGGNEPGIGLVERFASRLGGRVDERHGGDGRAGESDAWMVPFPGASPPTACVGR